MSGSKADDAIKERAYALFAVKSNISAIARELGVPDSTVRGWKRKYDKECERDPVKAKARDEQKRAFVDDCWAILKDATSVLARRINRALEEEDKIDALVDEVADATVKVEMDPLKASRIISKVEGLKCEDIVKLSTVMGTLYDKQALASGESTENVNVTPFEGL